MKQKARQKISGKKIASLILASTMVLNSLSPLQVLALDYRRPNFNLDDTKSHEITNDSENLNYDDINNKNKDSDMARLYVHDEPLRLRINKIKTKEGDHEGKTPKDGKYEKENTYTYEFSGRINGSETEILQEYGGDRVELAYSDTGKYLGYGWLRGTKEYLEYRKEHKDEFGDLSVELIYNDFGVFDGYAYVTKRLETADDTNRYVAGAKLSFFDSIEIQKNKTKDLDEKFKGVKITRDANNTVTSVVVQKGYAGEKTEFVKEKTDETKITTDNNGITKDDNYHLSDNINDSNEKDNKNSFIWTAKTIQRDDTNILFYSLSNLHITSNDIYNPNSVANTKLIDKVFGTDRINKNATVYGFNRKKEIVDITNKDWKDFSVFAFTDDGITPEFELVGGDYSKIKYNSGTKIIELDPKTKIYHLDEDGNRDSLVDPFTGIAYITEEKDGVERIYTWAVNLLKDGSGNTGTELGNLNSKPKMKKISTTRMATINADTNNEYTVGTYNPETNEFKHIQNPTLNKYGMPVYYNTNNKKYVKGQDFYDRDGDYLGYMYFDKLNEDNTNSYIVNNEKELYDGNNNGKNTSNSFKYSTKQKIQITVADNNTPDDFSDDYIINANSVLPKPQRVNFNFVAWMHKDFSILNEGDEIVAKWSISKPNDLQKDKWFTDKEAVGNTRTFNVTCDANGGTFINGNGNIHSSDNYLYYKMGAAYLMENTYITGETTPNDPFDKQFTRDFEFTDTTANDPYTNTDVGGTVDMIKRTPSGNYIIEEIKAPTGYVKSLPKGVTIKEDLTNNENNINDVEIVDKTIKVQLIKKDDTTSDYYYKELKNGSNNYTLDDANQEKKFREPTNSFTFKHVKNATLKLTSIDKDNKNKELFKKWIAATNHPDIQKSDNGEFITFNSTKPLYLEGIPKGKYLIEEINTPAGYVTMKPKEFEIKEVEDVQTFIFNDDHTKLEINKFINEGNGRISLPNNNKATLSLVDRNGNIVQEYKTDSIEDFKANADGTSFIEKFEKSIKEHGKVDNFKFTIKRTAYKKTEETKETWYINDGTTVVVTNGNIPATASKGFREAYNKRNLATERDRFTWIIEETASKIDSELNNSTSTLFNINGTKVLATAIKSGNEYKFEYKFNVKDDYENLGEIYNNLITYDTVKGTHRFDYLPLGEYVIKETNVPRGFVKANDVNINVKNDDAIQLYDIENKERVVSIFKFGSNEKDLIFDSFADNIENFNDNGKVIKGAKFKLFKVNILNDEIARKLDNGEEVEDAKLIEEFESGNDGIYTESDKEKELIPNGFNVGENKPHILRDLKDGFYYIVESETPNYLAKIKPYGFELNENTTSLNLRHNLVNKEALGKITVIKKNNKGGLLSNAYFKVVNLDTNTDVGTFKTVAGKGTMNIPDIGKFDNNGKLIPYRFGITEINPPAGYAVDHKMYEFKFNSKDHGEYTYPIGIDNASFNNGILTLINETSAISLSKLDFKTLKGIDGNAILQIKEVEFNDNKWNIKENVIDEFTFNSENITKSIIGLIGGNTYAIVEKEASSYSKINPIFFRVSDDAKYIEKIWYDENENNLINFKLDKKGTIEKMTLTKDLSFFSTSKLYKLNENNEKIFVKELYNSPNGVDISTKDLDNNLVYTLDVILSDNEVLDSYTFKKDDDTKNVIHVDTKYPISSKLEIKDEDGNLVKNLSFENTKPKYVKTVEVDNSLITDNQKIIVKGNGENHSAVYPQTRNNIVLYEMVIEKKGSTVIWTPDEKTLVRDTSTGSVKTASGYKWITSRDNELIKFSTIVKDSIKSGYINQIVTVNDKPYSYMNPIIKNSGENLYINTSKLLINHEVKGTDETNESYNFVMNVKITDNNGNPLRGEYVYTTKNGIANVFRANQKNTSFNVVLTGNDYVVVNNLPYGSKYEASLQDESLEGFTTKTLTMNGETNKQKVSSVLFESIRDKTMERETFIKNKTYHINKILNLNDSSDTDNKLTIETIGFSLGEDGQVVGLQALDKKLKIVFHKLNKFGEYLSGAEFRISSLNNPEVKDEFVTEGKPFVIENSNLNTNDTLVVTETKAPDGYLLEMPFNIKLTNNALINNITVVDKEPEVKILKTDEDTGKVVAGATFVIVDENDNEVRAIKDTNIESVDNKGRTIKKGEVLRFKTLHDPIILKGLLSLNKNYFIKEESSPNGYLRTTLQLMFKITQDEFSGDPELHSIMVDKTKIDKTQLNSLYPVKDPFSQEQTEEYDCEILTVCEKLEKLDKKSEEYKELIRKYGNCNKCNKVCEECVNNPNSPECEKCKKEHEENGTCPINGEGNENGNGEGKCELESICELYKEYKKDPDNPKYEKFRKCKKNLLLTFKDEKIDIRMKKTDFTTTKEVPGATITITDENGNIVEKFVSTKTEHYFTGKYIGGKTYTLTEVGPPTGYYYTDSLKFTVPMDKTNTGFNGNFIINNVDETTGKYIANSRFIIVNELGVTVREFETINNDPFVIRGLEDGEYTLRQVFAPDGYELTQDVHFSIKFGRVISRTADGRVVKSEIDRKKIKKEITIKNKRKFVEVFKVDAETGIDIEGAVLDIKKESGELVHTFVTDKTPHKIKLDDGTYILSERKAPNNYQIAKDIKFIVKDGSVFGGKIIMKDTPSRTVAISKIDAVGKSEISGAKLIVTDKDGNIIDSWISKANTTHIIKNLKAGRYTLTEILAPDGFSKAESVSFEVNENGETNGKVVMEDRPEAVVVSKQDVNSGEELKEAKLRVMNMEGQVVARWTTKSGESKVLRDLPDGKYLLIEEESPEKYDLAPTYEFSVVNGVATVGVVILNNKMLPYSDNTIRPPMVDEATEATFKKTDITNANELPGASLEITDKTGYIIDKWISTDKPHIVKAKLTGGESYTMTEKASPNGYYYSESINFTMPKYPGQNPIIEMKDAPIDVRIKKTDLNTNSVIIGAKLRVRDKETGEIVDEWVSENDEHLVNKDKLIAERKYILEEIEAPEGYYLADNIEFTIPKYNQGIIRLEMKDRPIEYDFSKGDISGKEIPGAKLTLKNDKNEIVKEWISKTTPTRITGLISGRKYKLTEELSPKGYYYSSDIEFSVPKKGEKIEKVVMIDEITKVKIRKIDKDTNKDLIGAKLQIVNKDNNVIEEWISDGKEHEINGKLNAQETYRLVEIEAPDGYFISDDIEFTLPKYDNGIISVTMKDEPTEVHFKKTDFINSKEVPGAKVTIKNKDGKIVESFISKEKPHIFKSKLTGGHTYTFIEEGPPKGYSYTTSVNFTMPKKKGEKPKLVEMKDKATIVEFIKKDKNGNIMSGAKMQVVDSNSNVIAKFTTTDKPYRLEKVLNVETLYKLQEIVSPDGYSIADDISFKLDKFGKLLIYNKTKQIFEEKNDIVVEMIDNEIILEIEKVDAYSLRKLDGAKLEIKDMNGKVIESFISSKDQNKQFIKTFSNGTILKVGDTYVLSETESPKGYLKAKDIKFTINGENKVQIITMKDMPTPRPSGGNSGYIPKIRQDVKFTKTGKAIDETATIIDSRKLGGAVYELLRKDMSVYRTITTEENGEVTFSKPENGTYYLREKVAPNGYMLDTKLHEITITNNSINEPINMIDYKKPQIKLYKADIDTKEKLRGAKFIILNNENKTVYSGTTNENGYIIFEPEIAGEYKAIEVQSPKGYKLNNTPINFKVSEEGIVIGENTIYNEKEELKIGSISAKYNKKHNLNENKNGKGKGRGYEYYINKNGRVVKIKKMGDNVDLIVKGIFIILLTMMVCYLYEDKKKKK